MHLCIGIHSGTHIGINAFSYRRQKQLVSLVQEYVRHITDSVRGEYRERICVRNANVRLYTHTLSVFEALKARIHNSAPPFKDEAYVKQLAHTVEQLRGRELPGFMSSQVRS
jgi:hypothetical protein